MECPHCKTRYESEYKDNFCPFCGHDLRSPAEKAKDHASFEFTWGLMHEQTLQKKFGKPDLKLRDEALANFIKSLKQDSKDTIHVTDFLERYPQTTPYLEKLAEDPAAGNTLISGGFFSQLSPARKVQYQLLSQPVISQKDPRAALRFLDLVQQDLEKLCFNRNTTSLEDLVDLNIFEDISSIYVEAATAALEREYVQAQDLLAGSSKQKPFQIKSWPVLERYTGVPFTLEERVQNIQVVLDQIEKIETGSETTSFKEDYSELQILIRTLLENLCRPLQEEEHAFDHLAQCLPQVKPFLDRHFSIWYQQALELISKEELLRGMHLFLQQIKNMTSEDESVIRIDELLRKHFEKVYMKPYEWITATDFVMLKMD